MDSSEALTTTGIGLDFWQVVMIVGTVVLIFLTIKNLLAKNTMKELARTQKVLEVHHETRRRVTVGRVLCGVAALLLACATVFGIFIVPMAPFTTLPYEFLTLVVLLAYYAIAPLDAQEWLITEDGLYTMASGKIIPWSEIVTSGVIHRKKRILVTVQIKRVKGEYFKVVYQQLGLTDAQKAENVSQLIRDFIHALDRAKLLHKKREEQKVEAHKRNFYI